jgi:hypothetical protein
MKVRRVSSNFQKQNTDCDGSCRKRPGFPNLGMKRYNFQRRALISELDNLASILINCLRISIFNQNFYSSGYDLTMLYNNTMAIVEGHTQISKSSVMSKDFVSFGILSCISA